MMKFSTAILFGLLIALATAPTASVSADGPLDTKGTWALQFGVVRDMRLVDFQGTALSLQRTTESGNIWRLGLSLNWRLSSTDEKEDNAVADYDGERERVRPSTASLTLQRVFRFKKLKNFQPYWGAGAIVSYGRSTSDDDPFENRTKRQVVSEYQIGLRLLIGAEHRFSDEVSVLGEYSTDLSYRWLRDTREVTYTESTQVSHSKTVVRDDSFRISTGAVKLAISLYF
jgi:opacity protein-like surface antigen